MKTNQIFTLSFSSFLLKGSSSSSKESEKFFFFPENDPLWILFLSLSLPLPLSLTLFLGELNPEKITTVIIIKKNVKKYEKKLYRKFFFSFSIKSNQQQPYHHSLLLLWFVNIYFFPIILHFTFYISLTHSLTTAYYHQPKYNYVQRRRRRYIQNMKIFVEENPWNEYRNILHIF